MYTYTHNALPERTSRKETWKVKSDSFPTIDMETIFGRSEGEAERIIRNQGMGSIG